MMYAKKKKKYEKGGVLEKLKAAGKKGKKEKKPDYSKTETFQDYKSAAATFTDYNPQSDTVFVGTSLDPGMADRKAQRQANISTSKGASKNNYNAIPKMYRTKNEAGQDVYVSVRKYDKNEYSKGGKMKATKKEYGKGGMMEYKKGGKLGKRKALDFNKDGKITKEDFAMLRGMAKNKKKKGKKVPKAAVGMALAGVAKIAAPLIKKAVIGSAVNAVKRGVDKQVNKAIG